MLGTSYFGNIRNLPKEANLISIARYTPRWFTEYTYPLLAPTEDILLKYKDNKINTDEYAFLYYRDVLSFFNPMHILQHLDFGNINILLCFEVSTDFCHRHLFRNWLNDSMGFTVITEY